MGHKDFAQYSRYDKLDRLHLDIKAMTDEYDVDWTTEDHDHFNFACNGQKKYGVHIDEKCISKLLLWIKKVKGIGVICNVKR